MIVPVKAGNVKSRLAGLLTEEGRREFAALLLADVLSVLTEARLAESTYVVSSDDATLTLAARMGANGVREPADRGVNSAVALGVKAAEDAESILVLPSDLPLLGPEDLDDILSLRGSGSDVVIAPSIAFNGTNALALSRSASFPLSYDADSFWNHLATAARMGLSVAVCCRRGLMFDVDSGEDFRALSSETLNRPSASFARSETK